MLVFLDMVIELRPDCKILRATLKRTIKPFRPLLLLPPADVLQPLLVPGGVLRLVLLSGLVAGHLHLHFRQYRLLTSLQYSCLE